MSSLDVDKTFLDYLMEDAHQRKVQTNKAGSSNVRNDLKVLNNKTSKRKNRRIETVKLGKVSTEQELEKVARSSGTISQNNLDLKLNRIAVQREMYHGKKNPPLKYKVDANEIGFKGHLYRKEKDVFDDNSGKVVGYTEKENELFGNLNAIALPNQNAVVWNSNSSLVRNYVENPYAEDIRFELMKSMAHEQSHIIFINWIEKKFGKKTRREISLRSAEATYKYGKAFQYFNQCAEKYKKLKKVDKHETNQMTIDAAQELKLAYSIYLTAKEEYYSDPLEKVAELIEQDMQGPDDIKVIERNLPKIYKILSDGVKNIRFK